ncbi:allantoinase [Mycobacterium sp. ACS1612]|uniref:allantoinase AllB n=1 Tax=Mycobacterium sp. ACS1612 TaxID=1834117 RepID=UPI0007FCA49A|nr:allantoinase AllB [Mycobacterium sp. ACS1612]OBF35896.1 allantoinase [Mycobacterium sp. ACS1612]
MDQVFRAQRAVVDGQIRAAAVAVSDGVIAAIEAIDAEFPAAKQIRLAESTVLMAGFVDTHVHINDPGTDWEGFDTATSAAAAAGITTVVDMPLDSDPVTTTVTALDRKRQAAQGNCEVDVAFWGGVVPGNADDLAGLLDAGVRGFKCFLADSGNPDFPPLNTDEFRSAAAHVAALDSVLLVHAESGHLVAHSPAPGGRRYASFLSSRPDTCEQEAVELVVDTARRTGALMHVVHVSSARSLPVLADAKRSGLPVTAETCPHYLTFAAEDIPDGATQFAACPPIRDSDNRELLWQGVADGVLDMIVSDHSPCAPSMKADGDFGAAFGGISSLEVGPRAVWTQAARRGFGLADLSRWMSQTPATLAGFEDRGRIAVGQRADLCVFDPDAEQTVDAGSLRHRHAVTPYDGAVLRGAALQTWLAGQLIYERVGQPA